MRGPFTNYIQLYIPHVNNIFYFFSGRDLALVIKYEFNITNEHDNEAVISKKRKFSDSRLEAVLKYSQLKLPAQQFLTYLENYGANFLGECRRY